MSNWIRAVVFAIGVTGCPSAVFAQSAPAPQPPPFSGNALDGAAAAPANRRVNAQPPQSPPQWRPGTGTSVTSSPVATTAALPLEDRVAMLESALTKANARIAELETRMRTHTHSVNQLSVGLLVEKLNGRDVPLAIGPRWQEGATGPARP
jgi:hypothetical protein